MGAAAADVHPKRGLPTAATFVFVNMLRKLRGRLFPGISRGPYSMWASRRFAPSRPKRSPAFANSTSRPRRLRETEYGGYKANRKEMPPDLGAASAIYPSGARRFIAFRFLQLAGLRSRRCSSARCRAKLRRNPIRCSFVSSDKDMLQLRRRAGLRPESAKGTT